MSSSRRSPHAAKLPRERIRREKHAQQVAESRAESLANLPRFATERSMREVQSVLEGQKFETADELNSRLAELTAQGQISERAAAWNQNDPKWRAQELAYDALETDDVKEALRLCNEAIKLDPDCTDAQRLLISLLATSLENGIRLMREVVEKAEQKLGDAFFAENAGHFWGAISTRPYMRAKQHLGELLVDAGQFDEAIAVYERMLELNPDDNQGRRYSLIALYLATNQPQAVDRLLKQYGEEEDYSAVFAWGRVMERWLAGNPDEAKSAVLKARRINRFAEAYISGARRLPAKSPEYFQPGRESEGQVCGAELEIACKKHPGFRQWLRSL